MFSTILILLVSLFLVGKVSKFIKITSVVKFLIMLALFFVILRLILGPVLFIVSFIIGIISFVIRNIFWFIGGYIFICIFGK